MKPRRYISLLLAIIALSGSAYRAAHRHSGPAPLPAADPANPPAGVTPVYSDDAEFNAAIAKAKQTSDVFMQAAIHPKPGYTDFSVIKRFYDPDGQSEDIWLDHLKYDGQSIIGTVDNTPMAINGLKLGDQATVLPADIIDWQYRDHGRLQGGYTIRASYAEGSPAEKQDLLKSGFTKADMVKNY
jgi:uncharacterized protein YegJ (DUF2314 family)